MRHTLLTSIIVASFFFICIVGGISQEVISSQGAVYSNSSGIISFTVGEPVISTVIGSNNDLTQGFQNPNMIPRTKLKSAYCNDTVSFFINTSGQTVDTLGQIWADSVTMGANLATNYEFKFINDADPTDIYKRKKNNGKPMTTLALVSHNVLNGDSTDEFNVTYSVIVRAEVEGIWGDWGDTCKVTSPYATPTTQIQSSDCGMITTAFTDKFWADSVIVGSSSATYYQFKFINDDDPTDITTKTKANGKPKASLKWAGITDESTTYNVVVRAHMPFSGWNEWGDTCQITSPTPAVPTQLQSSDCDITVSSFTEKLWADTVVLHPNVPDAYEFTFTNDDDPTDVYIKTNYKSASTSLNYMGISKFDATYNVIVRSWIGNSYTEFGDTCQITSPTNTQPTTQLTADYCNTTATSFTQPIWADSLLNNTSGDYQFKYINESDPTDVYLKVNNNKPKSSLTWMGISDLSTTYNVIVRAWIGNGWIGWGDTCQIISPATAMITNPNAKNLNSNDESQNTVPVILIYPNPNDGKQFYINTYGFETSDDPIIIRITDVYGKLIYEEVTEITANQMIKELNFRNEFADGIYLIKVSKGDASSIQRMLIH